VVRGSMDDHEFSVFYVDGRNVKAALSVGRSGDLDHARRFISEKTQVDAAALGDASSDLASL
jgi:3-phenylpropionate/trans-cinnamate dioxygenase ferredoxin reductase subunit